MSDGTAHATTTKAPVPAEVREPASAQTASHVAPAFLFGNQEAQHLVRGDLLLGLAAFGIRPKLAVSQHLRQLEVGHAGHESRQSSECIQAQRRPPLRQS
jgi:hypothetical protein